MKYSNAMVGRTLSPISRSMVPPASEPLSLFGATWWAPMARVQSPADWAAAGRAKHAAATARSVGESSFMFFLGSGYNAANVLFPALCVVDPGQGGFGFRQRAAAKMGRFSTHPSIHRGRGGRSRYPQGDQGWHPRV